MTESILAENMFGVKSFYELDVISKSDDLKELVIITWDNKRKKLKYNENKKCYVVDEK